MPHDIHAQRILVLDFGSESTQLIARSVRAAGVYCEIYGYDVGGEAISNFAPNGIILSGGSEIAPIEPFPAVPKAVFELGVPVLGIGHGMQALAAHFGGATGPAAGEARFDAVQVRARGHSRLLRDIEDHLTPEGYGLLDVQLGSGSRVLEIPPGFKLIASSESCPIAGIGDDERAYYGIQFHPELDGTRQGKRILTRFVVDICGCRPDWTPANIIADSIARIRAEVGSDQVLLGLSGGVDSSVVAAMLHKAIGDQLTCVFVDNGLLRLNEGDQVMATFAEHMGVKVIRVDAENLFLERLAGVADPEEKRKIIGRTFIEVFETESSKLENVKWLAQGTIYPDVIESAGSKTSNAKPIKSHHNVGGLPETMQLKLIEPLRELFKDEVRKIGLELGLPADMVFRHPFPGPGLGVRILGEIRKEYADLLRQADHIFIEELRRHDLYDKVSQAFTVFLPVKSVGATSDGRRYEYVVSLRAVETIDFMTARWARLPYDFLDLVSTRIIHEISGISRVAYDISSKPPATIEWE
jgi:GMP synthase (glutamine-hydrolysing)